MDCYIGKLDIECHDVELRRRRLKKMFQCDCCGLCCMKVGSSPLYCDLDRGDGICRYFDCNSRLCTIYYNRPDRCNVDKSYEMYFKDKLTLEQYYELNYEVCKKLKGGDKNVFIRIEQ
jgi:hypothetical protein